jgi:hypothetical protein
MPAPPAQAVAKSPGADPALYQATLQEVVAGASVLMGKLVETARQALQQQESATRELRAREDLATAANQLRRCEAQLCSSYPQALQKAFAAVPAGKKSQVLSVAEVQFDQLELMDDAQVQTSVTLARIQQNATQFAGAQLLELDRLICSVQGLASVRGDHNPLRPEVFVGTLKEVVEQTGIAPGLQILWLNAMAAPLGLELRTLYGAVGARLRQGGVVPAAYASAGGFASHGGAANNVATAQSGNARTGTPASAQPATHRVHGREQALLTLDKLRQLLSGELNSFPPLGRMEQFAQQFAQQFESEEAAERKGPVSDFDATVPAALEALTEMKQVDQVLQSLEQRLGAATARKQPQAHSMEGQRLALRRGARDIAQVLSLEVVTLMVDNMARDARLLEPVREVVRQLEPALLRLALVDQRFFTDKQHPARLLLHELTHNSLAFESSVASGFAHFLQGLQKALAPLMQAPIESAEVFETQLQALRAQWSAQAQASQKARELAVEVLQHAEARNLLAEKIAHKIVAQQDTAQVPAVVVNFLCGPWAQVVAQARIKQGAGSATAERFEALIPAMLWSAHPELARASPAKLTRLVPRLLANLRDGLDTIQYPATLGSSFLEALMAIHQTVFRAHAALPAEQAVAAGLPQVDSEQAIHAVVEGDPWMAPEEVRASNFVALQDSPAEPAPADAPLLADLLTSTVAEPIPDSDFALGSWVELFINGQWQRTQLTWASPHGTLYLFTSVFGSTQSMTRRSRDKLLSGGRLRLVSGQAVDQEALDAVAKTAMRNSVDSGF